MQLTLPKTIPIKNKSPEVCDLTSPTEKTNGSDGVDFEMEQRSLFPEELKKGLNEES